MSPEMAIKIAKDVLTRLSAKGHTTYVQEEVDLVVQTLQALLEERQRLRKVVKLGERVINLEWDEQGPYQALGDGDTLSGKDITEYATALKGVRPALDHSAPAEPREAGLRATGEE